MTDASAIPDFLYLYSERCTRGAQELQDWVRAVLRPTMNAYEAGGGICLAIAGEVTSQVAAAQRTDQNVRTVGKAFERAGSSLPGPAMPFSASDAAVGTAYRTLLAQSEHQAEMAAGAALARKLSIKDWDTIEQIIGALASHADDPYFAAGFYNSLTPEQIAVLIGRGSDDRALASAFASGALTSTAMHNFLEALGWVQGSDLSVQHWHITAAQQVGALNALAANPVAAANFARMMTTEDFRQWFDSTPFQNGRDPGDYSTQIALLRVFTVAAGQADSAEDAKALLDKVTPAFEGTPPADKLKAVLPALSAFLAAGGAHLMTTPMPRLTGDPQRDDAALGDWAANSAANLHWLAPFVHWVERGAEAEHERREKYAGGLAEFSIDFVVDTLLDLVPVLGKTSSEVANRAIHAMFGTLAVQALEHPLAQRLTEGGNREFDAALARQVTRDLGENPKPGEVLDDVLWQKAKVLTTVRLFEHYDMYQDGRRVTLQSALGTSDPERMQERLLERINDEDGEWARSIEIRGAHGHVTNLRDVLANLKDRAVGAPKF